MFRYTWPVPRVRGSLCARSQWMTVLWWVIFPMCDQLILLLPRLGANNVAEFVLCRLAGVLGFENYTKKQKPLSIQLLGFLALRRFELWDIHWNGFASQACAWFICDLWQPGADRGEQVARGKDVDSAGADWRSKGPGRVKQFESDYIVKICFPAVVAKDMDWQVWFQARCYSEQAVVGTAGRMCLGYDIVTVHKPP